MYTLNKEFDKINTIRAFLELNNTKGRANLAKKINVGEGVIRRILNTLKEKELIEPTNKGHRYSKKGLSLYNKITKKIIIKNNIKLNLFKKEKNTAILVKNPKNIKINFILRDIAIRNQASGAMIFKYKKNKLELPDCDYSDKSFKTLQKNFNFDNNDVLIMTFSNEQLIADVSCFSVALNLTGNIL